ncbi:hypothetical protein HY632_02375 [Candidatus Uhrbacteria bacterium]|nr:hypothetical protein [Candidatus Uhrbacteria bacterium]
MKEHSQFIEEVLDTTRSPTRSPWSGHERLTQQLTQDGGGVPVLGQLHQTMMYSDGGSHDWFEERTVDLISTFPDGKEFRAPDAAARAVARAWVDMVQQHTALGAHEVCLTWQEQQPATQSVSGGECIGSAAWTIAYIPHSSWERIPPEQRPHIRAEGTAGDHLPRSTKRVFRFVFPEPYHAPAEGPLPINPETVLVAFDTTHFPTKQQTFRTRDGVRIIDAMEPGSWTTFWYRFHEQECTRLRTQTGPAGLRQLAFIEEMLKMTSTEELRMDPAARRWVTNHGIAALFGEAEFPLREMLRSRRPFTLTQRDAYEDVDVTVDRANGYFGPIRAHLNPRQVLIRNAT